MVHVALPAAGQPNSVVVTWQTPAPGMASEVGVRSLDEPRAGWQWFSGEFQTDRLHAAAVSATWIQLRPLEKEMHQCYKRPTVAKLWAVHADGLRHF